MTIRDLILLPAMLIMAACSCGNADVPRRYAQPRVEPYDTMMTTVDGIAVHLEVNAQAVTQLQAKQADTQWIDVTYPRYHATLHLTLSQASGGQLQEMMSNRHERTMLNTGGNDCEITEITSPTGVTTQIFLAPGATVTPLQILATDSATFLLSGAVQFAMPDCELNAPAVQSIYRDLINTAKTLRP